MEDSGFVRAASDMTVTFKAWVLAVLLAFLSLKARHIPSSRRANHEAGEMENRCTSAAWYEAVPQENNPPEPR
eukprot:4155373-Amphidinium_carterae.1